MSKIWTDELIDILICYLKNGVTLKNISKKIGKSIDSISGAIRRYDLNKYIIQKPLAIKYFENTDIEELKDKKFDDFSKECILNWKIVKSKKPIKTNRNFEIGLLWPDTHIPHQNDPACKAILKLMKDLPVNRFTIMGDFLDLGCISHWNKNRHKTLEMQRLKKDYIIANSLLDEIDKRLPKNCKKDYLRGNHEIWLDDLIEQIPQLEGLVELESALKLKERGYTVYEYNELVKIGRLFVTHGIYVGGNPIKKHLDELKVNIAFAHTHTLGMSLSSSPAREIAFSGYNIGCVCDMGPDYMKNKPHAWTHGFAIVYYLPNGYFDVQLVRIVEGKFIFNNKLYDGNI